MDIPFYKCDAYGNTFIIAYHNNAINKNIFDSNSLLSDTIFIRRAKPGDLVRATRGDGANKALTFLHFYANI